MRFVRFLVSAAPQSPATYIMISLLKKTCLITAILAGTALLQANEEPEICPACSGLGETEDMCMACAGQGVLEEYAWVECGACDGSGAQGGSICYACNGFGAVEGWDLVTCNSCNGSGVEVSTCDTCNGTGVIWLWVAIQDAFRDIHYAEIHQRDVLIAC